MLPDVYRFRRTSSAAISVIMNGCILLQFLQNTTVPSVQWKAQFVFLLALSTGCTIAAIIAVSPAYRIVFSIVKSMLVLLMLIPVGDDTYLRVFLVLSAVLELGILLPVWFSVGYVLLGAYQLLRPAWTTLVWDDTVVAPSLFEEPQVFGLYLACVALLVLIRVLSARNDVLRKMNADQVRGADRLAHVNADLQDGIAALERRVLLNERNRVSRELHDIVGYTMVSQIMTMEAAIRLTDRHQQELREVLTGARDSAQNAMQEVRSAMRNLRSTESQLAGDIWDINKLAGAFQGTDILVHVEYRNAPHRYTPPIQKLVYRFVQEGITNAIQHGHASRIDVFFWLEAAMLYVTVADNGIGSDIETDGIGLQGIRERLAVLGGTVTLSSGRTGFSIRAAIPVSWNEYG